MNWRVTWKSLDGKKITGNKNELVACAFSSMENNVMPVRTPFEVEEDLKKE